MADENRISTSKREIYSKFLDIAGKYIDTENNDFLKSGAFGWVLESMAMMYRDSTYHKSMLYNEGSLYSAVLPSTIYRWAKLFGIDVQKAIPAYAEIDLKINKNSLENFLINGMNLSTDQMNRYGRTESKIVNEIILDKENPIIAGDYYFSLEHSISIKKINESFVAEYLMTDYTSTEFQDFSNKAPVLITSTDSDNIIIKARAYQYKRARFERQIVSTSFLNKVQRYEFEDQFCGAKLFYTENGKKIEIPLKYSDLDSTVGRYAFYNLTDSNEIEITFKSTSGSFLPSPNTILTTYIYSTKGTNVPASYTGDAFMKFNENDLKSLPLVISFNPSVLVGGKDMQTLNEIKQTIIKEISTRNTITTQSDLNNYFDMITRLIGSVNDGKVKFIKQRDDIIKRVYNAFLLLRDNSNDSTTDDVISENGFVSPCVPTTTLDIAGFKIKKDETKTTSESTNETNLLVLNNNEKLDSNGDIIIADDADDYYSCPFKIFVLNSNIKKVEYVYDQVDQTSKLSYNNSSSGKDTNFYKVDGGNQYYITPISVSLYRGFSNNNFQSENGYTVTFTLETNNLNLTKDGISNIYINSKPINISDVNINFSSESNGIRTMTILTSFENNGFTFTNNYINGMNIEELGSIKESTILNLDLIGSNFSYSFKSDDKMQFYQILDDIMESSFEVKTTGNSDGTEVYSLKSVPVVHSSFFKNATETKRKGFVSQLFSYINILKENLERLETSTFFNLKFYNTYGTSMFYDTPKTNIDLELNIELSNSTIPSDTQKQEGLMQEIRSYIRRAIDQTNSSENGFNVDDVIALIKQPTTYGNYINHVEFYGLNDTFKQRVKKVSSDIKEYDYPPEWLNLDGSTIADSIHFDIGE